MSLAQKEQTLLENLARLSNEDFYDKIMELGRKLPPFPSSKKISDNRVIGCQSLMYCDVEILDGKLALKIDSEALISKGLAAIFVQLYEGLTIEEALNYRPRIFSSPGPFFSLSLSRQNGIASLLRHVLKKIIMLKASA